MKHLLALVVLGVAAIVAVATGAQAGTVTNTTASYAFSGWVSCANGGAGELVNGTVEARNLVTETTNDNVDAYQFQTTLRGALVGAVSGDSYRLNAIEHGTYVENAANDHYTATYVNRYRLIGSGQASNLVVRETSHVTRDGDTVIVDHDSWDIECS